MATILVLDDVSASGVMVQRILSRKGHLVHAFFDEDEALRFAKSEEVDLAVLDMKLRKMEGVEVLAELRKLQPTIRCIMLTGYPTADSVERALGQGAAAYCVKPVEKQELEETVAAVLADGAAQADLLLR
ncbi:MAG: response regulator [Desulfobulbaceae bacterium]|nr:response regulator [Desulfobulbaceae bacterium]